MREYDREFIENVITELIPGVRVTTQLVPTSAILEQFMVRQHDARAGYFRRGEEILIWGHIDAGQSFLFSVTRNEPPLSSRERSFLYLVPDVLTHLLPTGGLAEVQQLQRLSSKMIIGTAIVAKFLQNKRGSGFWPPSFLLSMLQTLVSQDYEGASATTGFLCVAKVAQLDGVGVPEEYEFRRFERPLRLHGDFFQEPISYRYVDGRNAFYVIDRQSDVQGILKIRRPLRWSLVDRVFGRHLAPLISALSGKVWAAIVGNARDIQILTALGPEIRWSRNRWQYLHLEHLRRYIERFTDNRETADFLLRLVFSLSVTRTGSLILIPCDDTRPEVVGIPGRDLVEAQIEGTVVGMHLREFVEGAGMFGVFGSDGLVIVGRDGRIETAGSIVSLPPEEQRIAGGGRTQAARHCSRYGLAIKVSEDGPISLFRAGDLVLRTNG
jgi:hypothetical protein